MAAPRGPGIVPAALRWRVRAIKEMWGLAAIGPCAEQGQSLGGLFLHISWANVGKMPTLSIYIASLGSAFRLIPTLIPSLSASILSCLVLRFDVLRLDVFIR